MLPQGGDAVLLSQGGGENELAAGEKGEDAEIRLPAAPLQGGNGQQGLDGAGVVRGMDDHRFAAREGAALQGGGVRDVRAAADDAEIFGTFHIFRDILLHLFPFHIVRHDDAGVLARGGQHQLPQESIFAGIEAQDHGMPAFQNLGIAPLQLDDLLLDGAGDDTDQHAGEEHARDGADGHEDDVAGAAVAGEGHPGVDEGGDAVPEHGEGLAVLIEAQKDDETGDDHRQHDGHRNEEADQAQGTPGDPVVEPIAEPLLPGGGWGLCFLRPFRRRHRITCFLYLPELYQGGRSKATAGVGGAMCVLAFYQGFSFPACSASQISSSSVW